MRAAGAPLALALAVLVLGGCGGGGPDDDPSPGSTTSTTSTTSTISSATTTAKESPVPGTTTLRQNLPTQVDGVRVIAYNIDEDGAALQLPDGRVQVAVGDEVDLDGTTWTVAETVPHSDERDEPRPNGWVSLTQD